MGTTKDAMDIDYESIFCCDVNNYTIFQMKSQNTGATSTQLKSSSQRASTTSTLSSLAIRLARGIWRKLHHGQQYLIFLPLSLVLEHQCFFFFFFPFGFSILADYYWNTSV